MLAGNKEDLLWFAPFSTWSSVSNSAAFEVWLRSPV